VLERSVSPTRIGENGMHATAVYCLLKSNLACSLLQTNRNYACLEIPYLARVPGDHIQIGQTNALLDTIGSEPRSVMR
jgi:hypothetical protein